MKISEIFDVISSAFIYYISFQITHKALQ